MPGHKSIILFFIFVLLCLGGETVAAQSPNPVIFQMKQSCQLPLLAIVDSETDRQTADARGADIVVMEGLPSAKLATHIATLFQQYLETETVESSGQES